MCASAVARGSMPPTSCGMRRSARMKTAASMASASTSTATITPWRSSSAVRSFSTLITATSTPTSPGCAVRSRPRKTLRWPSGHGCSRTFSRGRCAECGCVRPRRTGPSAAMMAEAVGQAATAVPLMERYSAADLRVFSAEESSRFLERTIADPQRDATLAWELLYRLEPELYERLVAAEPLHPGILEWLPPHVPRITEVGAGTGRLTIELVARCDQLTAVEPAAPLRERLRAKLTAATNTRIISGFFDALPLADRSAELVIACSALTPEPAHGGDRGLAEMERVCAAGGMVVIVWPNHPDWL